MTETPTTPAPAAPKADDGHLAVQRHEMDEDGQERYFATYPIKHPEWYGSVLPPDVAELLAAVDGALTLPRASDPADRAALLDLRVEGVRAALGAAGMVGVPAITGALRGVVRRHPVNYQYYTDQQDGAS